MTASRAIGRVRCEDCGPSLITGPEKISVFFDGDDYFAISKCGYCNRTIYVAVDEQTAENFSRDGVKIFSWLTGSEIMRDLVN